MFGRKGRRTPFQRETDEKLEQMRDDCIALFVDSRLTQQQIADKGGPTPQTISKWLYGETRFPRFDTISRFLRALDAELIPVASSIARDLRDRGRAQYLGLDIGFAGRPKMPRKAARGS